MKFKSLSSRAYLYDVSFGGMLVGQAIDGWRSSVILDLAQAEKEPQE